MQEIGMKFKYLGVVARLITLRNLDFQIPVSSNSPENHETWNGVISWHQHAVIKKLAKLGQVLV
jgi:hypothetical protein